MKWQHHSSSQKMDHPLWLLSCLWEGEHDLTLLKFITQQSVHSKLFECDGKAKMLPGGKSFSRQITVKPPRNERHKEMSNTVLCYQSQNQADNNISLFSLTLLHNIRPLFNVFIACKKLWIVPDPYLFILVPQPVGEMGGWLIWAPEACMAVCQSASADLQW